MLSKVTGSLVVAWLALSLGSCSGPSCIRNTDCESGLACIAGTCQARGNSTLGGSRASGVAGQSGASGSIAAGSGGEAGEVAVATDAGVTPTDAGTP